MKSYLLSKKLVTNDYRINLQEFEQIVVDKLGRDIRENKNPEQNKAISAPIDQSQFIVASSGSGKTTIMALKLLKFSYVDDKR